MLKTLSVALVLAACGGGGGKNPVILDSGADAPPDTPPLPPGCDYAELQDATNDDLSQQTGAAETTNLTFTASTVLCGKLDAGHFQPGMNPGDDGLVDVDSFSVTVGADATVLGSLVGPGIEGLSQVQFAVFDSQGNAISVGTFLGDHGVLAAALPADTYTFTVLALNGTAPPAAIDYKLKVITDDPIARCGKVAAAADVTETNDGANNTGNDMVDVRFGQDPTMNRVLTLATGDKPDNDAAPLAIAPGDKKRISGSSANVNAADEYRDRDTFVIQTGATTNQVSVRLNWADITSDHDFMVFNENTVPEVVGGTLIGNTEDEFVTFAALPNTKYWVWTGTYDTLEDGTTAPTLPAAYDISICGEAFVP